MLDLNDGIFGPVKKMATVEEITEYFNECSKDYRRLWTNGKNLAMHYGYWDSGTLSLQDAIDNLNRLLSEKACIGANDIILDAGCGMGGSAIWLAEHIGTRVVGVNVCEKDARNAAKAAKRRNVRHLVEIRHCDMRDTGLDASSFGVVWAVKSIVHTNDKPRFFHEAHTLLKNGGKLIIADGFLNKERSMFTENESRDLEAIERGWAITITTPGEYLEGMRKAGFSHIEFDDITSNIKRTARHIYIRGVLLHPLAFLLRVSRIRTRRSVDNCVACKAQYRLFTRGCWCYGIISARK